MELSYGSQDEIILDLEWALNPIMSILIKFEQENTQRHRGRPCEDGGRDWNDACTSPGMLRTADQKLGERH